MGIVGGLDVHRRQITFDYLDEGSGVVHRGRIQASRETLRRWLATEVIERPARFAVEACTGWRFVIEELAAAGIEAHLAEPADTAAARGPKRRAKTDRLDARHLRDLLASGRLPESWIPPEQVTELRALLELFKDLRDEHTGWVQRLHATLFHQGAPAADGDLLGAQARRRLEAGVGLSAAAHQQVLTALRGSTASTPSWSRCGARSPAANPAVAPYKPTTASVRSPRRRSGPSSATPAGSPPPARPSGTPGWTSPCIPWTTNAPPASSPSRARRCFGGRCSRPPSAPPDPALLITPTTPRSVTAPAVTEPPSRWPARSPGGRTTPCVTSATRPSHRSEPRKGSICGARICPPTDARGLLLSAPRRRTQGAGTASKDRAVAPSHRGRPYQSSRRRRPPSRRAPR
jgi:transposase